MSQDPKQEKPESLVCAIGSETTSLQDDEIRSELTKLLDALGGKENVLLLPPDFTRFHSQSGKITQMITDYYGYTNNASPDDNKKVPQVTILPTLGTHAPMTSHEIKRMFGSELASKDPSPFVVHDWRNDVETIGHVPSEMVSNATRGMVQKSWPAQLNKLVFEIGKKQKSVVFSIGQVVPHEVMGMANFNKNMFVGAGGLESINLSHFIGAVYGMENMMGRAENPLRSILNYASEHFLSNEIELWYILTVMGTCPSTGELQMKGLFIGKSIECYKKACDLSLKANFTMLDRSPKKMVVFLNDDEFHSTWLGNKSIYRTRMAIADGGELIVLAPGVKKFGEDPQVDLLIRKYGYIGTPNIMKAMESSPDLKESLGTVAHLIHGSSEGRFSVTYCPGHLTKQEIESVGFQYASLEEMQKKYDVSKLQDGWHTLPDGEEFYFIKNPALGLWAVPSRFEENS